MTVSEVVPDVQNPRPKSLPPPPVQDLTAPPVPPEPSVAGPPLAQNRAQGRTPMLFGATPLAAAFRFVEPTWRNYIMYVDMEARAGNPDARRYLDNWNSLSPKERMVHFPEQLCELSTVTPSELIRWVAGQAWMEGSTKAAMCMTFMRDKVLERTAEFGMADPDNYKHAELFMRASGLLPTAGGNGRGSGGSSVTIFNTPVASSGSVALSGSRSESSPVAASGLRAMDEDIVELSRVMQTEGPEELPNVPDEPEEEEEDEDEETD